MTHHAYLAIEFTAVFVVLPTVTAFHLRRLQPLAALWIMAAVCLWWMMMRAGVAPDVLWRLPVHSGLWLRTLLVVFGCLAAPITLLAWKIVPQDLFQFPRQKPGLYLSFLVFYLLLSVLPQGVIYRAFLFTRYAGLFPNPVGMILASAGVFAFVHIIYRNWVAPVLCLGGGLVFAWVYRESGSLMMAALFHWALGGWIFTVGLGVYFFYGPPAPERTASR